MNVIQKIVALSSRSSVIQPLPSESCFWATMENSFVPERSDLGKSSGVYFIRPVDVGFNPTLVIKIRQNPQWELAATTMADFYGVRAPGCSMISLNDSKGMCIKEKMSSAITGFNPKDSFLQFANVDDGYSLSEVNALHMSSLTQDLLIDIGRIPGFDIVIQNTDRFPHISQVEHLNLGNVMVVIHEGRSRAIAIDQSIGQIMATKDSETKRVVKVYKNNNASRIIFEALPQIVKSKFPSGNLDVQTGMEMFFEALFLKDTDELKTAIQSGGIAKKEVTCILKRIDLIKSELTK